MRESAASFSVYPHLIFPTLFLCYTFSMQRNKKSTLLQQHPRTKKYLGVVLRNKRGFTLIELLTVISVISFIATAGIAALNTARAKARDATILADVDSLAKALDFYYDEYGIYPASGEATLGYAEVKGNATNDTLRNALLPYMPNLPNPGTMVDTLKGGEDEFSRIRYTAVDGLYKDDFSAGEYAILFMLKTNTALGPSDRYIRLSDGTVGSWWNVCFDATKFGADMFGVNHCW